MSFHYSCCVDEIAAEHASVDAVIHFGSSCLSNTKRLPLLLVFPKYFFQLENAVAEIKKVLQSRTLSPIVLLYDVGYAHSIELLYTQLEKEHSVILSKLRIPHGATSFVNEHLVASVTSNEGSQLHSVGGREFWLPTDAKLKGCTFLYVGCNGRTLSNIMLSLYQCQFLLYDPLSNTSSELASSGNKSLMKRYYLVERARDAKTVAILVGTLGIAGYMDMIDHLRKLASLAGKKAYTIVVGKPNPAKLANFPEIDVFILVACPESTIIDQKEFYKPIITPHEFVLACTGCQEGMDIVTNFGEILPGGVHHIATLSDQPCETSVSLISGGIRQLGTAKQDSISESSLATRGNNQLATIHSGAGGEFLMNRTWRGLERHQGEDPISSLVQGKHGIATSYENENSLFEKPNN